MGSLGGEGNGSREQSLFPVLSLEFISSICSCTNIHFQNVPFYFLKDNDHFLPLILLLLLFFLIF